MHNLESMYRHYDVTLLENYNLSKGKATVEFLKQIHLTLITFWNTKISIFYTFKDINSCKFSRILKFSLATLGKTLSLKSIITLLNFELLFLLSKDYISLIKVENVFKAVYAENPFTVTIAFKSLNIF